MGYETKIIVLRIIMAVFMMLGGIGVISFYDYVGEWRAPLMLTSGIGVLCGFTFAYPDDQLGFQKEQIGNED